ncbi:MAG: hypothetical protein ACK4MD_04865 [Demequina sp.]
MSEHTPARCNYSASGHMTHPIQYRLAFRASEPKIMQIVGEHPLGITVAPLGKPDHVESWCMHEEWREVVRKGLASGLNMALSYEHGLASIGGEHISHTSPEHWTDCPLPEQLQPWETGFFTAEQVLGAADAGEGSDPDHT